MNSAAAAEQVFDRLEHQKQTVLTELSAWPEERLRFQPEPKSWSALNVVDHLVKVEAAFLSTIESNLPLGNSVGVRDRLGALMVNLVMRSPIRIKVPETAREVIPDSTGDLAAIVIRWTDVRQNTNDFLGKLTPEQLDRGLFRHPVSGWMTVQQGLSFLSVHLEHHRPQIRRLKLSTKSRSSTKV